MYTLEQQDTSFYHCTVVIIIVVQAMMNRNT